MRYYYVCYSQHKECNYQKMISRCTYVKKVGEAKSEKASSSYYDNACGSWTLSITNLVTHHHHHHHIIHRQYNITYQTLCKHERIMVQYSRRTYNCIMVVIHMYVHA